MAHDSAPSRVFNISELSRLIASQLVLISPKSAVNLARTCGSLEEPVLSTLWGAQWSLHTLLKTLPEETWRLEHPGFNRHVVRGLCSSLERSEV